MVTTFFRHISFKRKTIFDVGAQMNVRRKKRFGTVWEGKNQSNGLKTKKKGFMRIKGFQDKRVKRRYIGLIIG